MRLSFCRRLVAINSGTVNKRLTISLLLCVLALVIVSNRMDSLHQVAMAADATTNVHQPLDHLARSEFTGKFLVPEALQDEFNLQKLAPTSFHTGVFLFSPIPAPASVRKHTPPKLSPYIVLSVLNL